MNRIPTVLARAALCCAFLLAASCAPKRAAAPAVPDHPSKLSWPAFSFEPPADAEHRVQLPRGAVAWFVESDELPLITLKAWFREEGRPSDTSEIGAHALLAGQMRRGGTADLTPAAVDDSLENNAVSAGLSVGANHATLSLDALDSKFAGALPLLRDLAVSPRIDPERLELARASALQGIAHRYDKPAAVSRDLASAVMRGFGHPGLWRAESADVASATREGILALSKNRFSPDGMLLAVSGRFDRAEMKRLLSEWIESWPEPGGRRAELPELPLRENPGIHLLDYDSEQAHVRIAQPFVKRPHPDYYATSVASYILGEGGFTSRLVSSVRSREGLAYSVYSYAGSSYFERATSGAALQTKAASAGKAVALVFAEMKRLAAEGPSEDELRRAVEGTIASLPSLFDSPENTAEALLVNELYGRSPDHYGLYAQELRKVTAEDVKRVAALYFAPEKMAVTIVGPAKEVLPSLRAELPGLPVKNWTLENLRRRTEP
ncbi:MAG: insulinase family protein [Fibrobacterales bacterium]|nr:insulinase family protein [Fibrobacterales bacterium]